MKTFTRIETCIKRMHEYQHLYLRVSGHEQASNFAKFMADNWQKELDWFPKEWVEAVQTCINLRS